MPKSVENLDIWQSGMEIVKRLYELTKDWPKEEKYGLTSQVRRAAVSVPTNISEGVGRGGPKEAARFGNIALGSLYELQTLIQIANDLEYLKEEDYSDLKEDLSVLSRRISSYVSYQENLQD